MDEERQTSVNLKAMMRKNAKDGLSLSIPASWIEQVTKFILVCKLVRFLPKEVIKAQTWIKTQKIRTWMWVLVLVFWAKLRLAKACGRADEMAEMLDQKVGHPKQEQIQHGFLRLPPRAPVSSASLSSSEVASTQGEMETNASERRRYSQDSSASRGKIVFRRSTKRAR